MNIEDHLKWRRFNKDLYSGVWLDVDCVTFGLWNVSGQLTGFQQYKPLANKNRQPNPRNMKYFTYAGQNEVSSKLQLFGVDLLDRNQKVCFISEGVFDVVPLHNLGVNALATLSNNPKHLKSWLMSSGYMVVALCDGDNAGKKLSNVAHDAVFLPDGKDPSDMSDEWFHELVRKF